MQQSDIDKVIAQLLPHLKRVAAAGYRQLAEDGSMANASSKVMEKELKLLVPEDRRKVLDALVHAALIGPLMQRGPTP